MRFLWGFVLLCYALLPTTTMAATHYRCVVLGTSRDTGYVPHKRHDEEPDWRAEVCGGDGRWLVGRLRGPHWEPWGTARVWSVRTGKSITMRRVGWGDEWNRSSVCATDNGVFVGFGTFSAGPVSSLYSDGKHHAMLWRKADARSTVDIHPTRLAGAWPGSEALGISGRLICGFVSSGRAQDTEATVWLAPRADAARVIHPGSRYPKASQSEAVATDGHAIVGDIWLDFGKEISVHAAVWTRPDAAACMDIHPKGLFGADGHSWTVAISGHRIVGCGSRAQGPRRAVLWWDLAGKHVTNLHPGKLGDGDRGQSFAHGIRGGLVVGEVRGDATDDNYHAILWCLKKERVVGMLDLHRFVPKRYVESNARGIAANGTIYGTVTRADGRARAAIWIPVR